MRIYTTIIIDNVNTFLFLEWKYSSFFWESRKK